MSEKWIKVSEKILDQLTILEKAKERDRLDLVRSMRLMLIALQRSLMGWMNWVNNPDIMSRFSLEDLEKMSNKLSEFTRSFLEYDVKATSLGEQRGLKSPKKASTKRPERFYV